MKLKEIWHKWFPSAENLLKKYKVISIEDIVGSFNIYLHCEETKKNVCVNFYKSTFIFRKTNVSFRSTELHLISNIQGENFFEDGSFFYVADSEYLYELVEEACGILNPNDFTHFVIVGSNCIVDVIAGYEPKIEFIDKLND